MQLSQLPSDSAVTLVRCSGKLSQSEIQHDQDPLGELLGLGTYGRRLLFDLGQTSYIDSSGVSWMLTMHKRFRNTGGKIVYHSAPPLVQQTLDLLRMSLILHLAPDLTTARGLALEGQS
jgi:anti-anti-sigma factor